jgi:hypothetical protein
MPYLPITLPSRGLHVDSAYSSLPPGFTLDSLNVLPYDAYKGKQRLGQRRALLGAFEFNDTGPTVTRPVQAIVRADAYVSESGTTVLRQRCVVVAGGEVYIIDPGDTVPYKVAYAASTSKLNATGDISVAIFGNYAYFVDGNKYRRMNITTAPASAEVQFWGTLLSSVTVNNSGHISFATATTFVVGQEIVATGTLTGATGTITGYTFHETFYVKTVISSTSVELSRTPTGVAIATSSGTTTGLTWIISGPEMTIKPSSNASSIGKAGAEAGERASLLVRFGGRLALSGFTPSPNNWFLSKINDVDDWIPGSGTANEDAVAGNLSTKFSIPGEPIVALIPMAESGLLFAGRHTMTYLSADPVFDTQARMIELSRSVGIVSAKAWCVSDAQTVYIMAQDGLYRVRPNEFQVTQSGRITGGRLDSFFQSQKFDKLNCSLGFDPEIQNIYCILSRTDLPSSSTHLVYSQATDSFWAIRTGWTAFQAPSCIGEFPFGDARSPVLALGSTSGYLGWFDRNLTSGVDGQAATGYKGAGSPFTVDNNQAAAQKIVSALTIGPVVSPNLSQVMLRDMRVELTMDEPQEEQDFNSPNVRLTGPFLSILSGQTAEEAIGEAIVNVTVTYDPSFPAVVLDGGVPFDSRTNLLLRSQELTTSPWRLGGTTLFIPNNVLAPDGTLTAETLIWNAGATVRNAFTLQDIAISPTTTYTYSAWIKSIGSTAKTDIMIRSKNAGGSDRALVAEFSEQTLTSSVVLNSGNVWTNVSTRVTSYPNNWWRVEVTGTSPSDTVSGDVSILTGQTGNGVIGAAVWGAQLEVFPAATAYIPTTSAAATAYIWDAESPYDFGQATFGTITTGIDNAYPESLAPHTYTTLDTLITDSTVRTYAFGDNRIYNFGVAPNNNWKIQNDIGPSYATLFIRDESLPETSLDTPGGVYVYGDGGTVLPLPDLPGSSPSPRIVVSSGTYTNTNFIQIGELQSGRNDALRCRIRDQAVFARIDSYGVPWAIERMAALIDPMTHTKNVKGSY